MVVNDLLVEHFPTIFDIGFTSQLEEELDEIAAGDRELGADAARVLRPVHRDAGQAEQTMERVKLKDEPPAKTARSAAGRW